MPSNNQRNNEMEFTPTFGTLQPLNAKSNHGGSDETIACLQTKMLSLRNAKHVL